MSQYVEPMSLDRILKLDSVCGIPVCIEPFSPQSIPVDVLTPRYRRALFFRVVNEEGNPFTVTDLERMCLNEDTVTELLELCRRRIEAIVLTYFVGSGDPSFFQPITCEVTEEIVNVSFAFSRNAKP